MTTPNKKYQKLYTTQRLSYFFEKEKEHIKIDDTLKQRIIGLTANTNTQWRNLKTLKQPKSIIETALDSSEPVMLHILEENISAEDKKSYMETMNSIVESYKTNFYPTEQSQNLKTFDELMKINNEILLNRYQGGKHMETYRPIDVYLIFLINYVEIKYYCLKEYDINTSAKMNATTKQGKYPNLYQHILDHNKEVFMRQLDLNEQEFSALIKRIHKIYSEKIRPEQTLRSLDLYKYGSIFKLMGEIITYLTGTFTANKKNEEDIKEMVSELYRETELSYKTFARKLAQKKIEDTRQPFTEEKYKTEYKSYLTADNPQVNRNKVISEIMDKNPIPPEMLELERKLLPVIMGENIDNYDEGLIKYLKQNSHLILGFSYSLLHMKYYSYMYNINIIAPGHDIVDIDEYFKSHSEFQLSCGLFADINAISNLFYTVLYSKFNKSLLFSSRLVLAPKNDDGSFKFDLSNINSENKSFNFDISSVSIDQLEIKYADILGIITIKSISEKGDIILTYIFLKKIDSTFSSLIFTKYNNSVHPLNIYGEILGTGQLTYFKNITHTELLVMTKLYNNTCYSIQLNELYNTDTVIKITSLSKKEAIQYYGPLLNSNDELPLYYVYNNNIVFFSNYSWDKIKSKIDNLNQTLVSKIIKYEIKDIRDETIKGINVFTHFQITKVDEYNFIQQSIITGGAINNNRLINLKLSNNNVDNNLDIVKNNLDYLQDTELSYKIMKLKLLLGKYNIHMSGIIYQLQAMTAKNILQYIKYYNNFNINKIVKSYKIDIEYDFNELFISKNINFKNKLVTEISYSNYNSLKYINDIKQLTLINYKTIDLSHISAGIDINYFNKFGLNQIKIDSILKKHNNINLKIIRDDIYKLCNMNINKQDILIYNNNLIQATTNAFVFHHIIYYCILVWIIKYLNKGGEVIIDLRTITTRFIYEFIYILELLFNKLEIVVTDVFKSNRIKGYFIYATGYHGDINIEKDILSNFKKLKQECASGLINIVFSTEILRKKYNQKLLTKSNTKIISSLLNTKIPQTTLNYINKMLNYKDKEVYETIIKQYKLFIKYMKGEKISINPITNEMINNGISYIKKYNLNIDINEIKQLKYMKPIELQNKKKINQNELQKIIIEFKK